MPSTTASNLTPQQQLDALQQALGSGEFWVSVGGAGNMAVMTLYPVNGDKDNPLDNDTLAKFGGTFAEQIEQLIAYQVAERLS